MGKKMVYETSSGGVVLRHIRGSWQVAIIEPNIINADTTNRRTKARPEGTVFALPKGGVDEGETPEQSADREVFEETGVRGHLLFRLTTIRYLYQRSWGGREHVSKAVSFYLFLYHSGRLGQISPEMRDEVRKAFWFPLDKAHRKLTYRGEREVLKMAQKIVREQPERLTPPPPSHPMPDSFAPDSPTPGSSTPGSPTPGFSTAGSAASGPIAPGSSVVRPQAQQRSASQRFSPPARSPAQRTRTQPAAGQPSGAPHSSGQHSSAQNHPGAQPHSGTQARGAQRRSVTSSPPGKPPRSGPSYRPEPGASSENGRANRLAGSPQSAHPPQSAQPQQPARPQQKDPSHGKGPIPNG